MTQEKMKKIITASVSAGTALLVFLLSFLIYQWITIAVLDKREKELKQEIAKWEETVDKNSEDWEFYQQDWGKEWLAHKFGWQYPLEDLED